MADEVSPDAEVRKRVKALLESIRDDEVNHGGLLSRRSLMLANQTQLEMTRPRAVGFSRNSAGSPPPMADLQIAKADTGS